MSRSNSSKAAATSAPAATAKATFNATGLLAGTAKPNFPVGPAGKIGVVYTGKLDVDPSGAGTLPIAIRNNTNAGISHVDVSAVARAGGQVVGTGTSQETDPSQLAPGAAALSFIYFDIGVAAKIPADATYSFSFETQSLDKSSYNTSDEKVTAATKSGQNVVGTGVNSAGASITGPYSVEVYCFNASSTAITSITGGFADQNDDLAPGAQLSYSVMLFDTCPTYLVGMTGFFS